MAMFKEAADIKTSDQLHLPVPDAKFETVVVKPSEIQQDMVQALSERAAEVHSGSVDPSVDNMLKITSDGRKIGLDQRLMNSALPDDPNSKLNACVNNVLRIWNDTKEQKLTQLIFCDMSTPKGDGSFNVYDDIRSKLLNAGVPEQEIEFIHNADTENKKAEQKRAWPRLLFCERTSLIMPGHARSMMPTAKPGIVRDFWTPTGKKSRCIRPQKRLLMKPD